MDPQNLALPQEDLGRSKSKDPVLELVESLLYVLERRGFSPSPSEREKIDASNDVTQLRNWLLCALMTAESVADAIRS